MATFRLRCSRCQGHVRRLRHSDKTRSFATPQEAQRWARSVESEMDRFTYELFNGKSNNLLTLSAD